MCCQSGGQPLTERERCRGEREGKEFSVVHFSPTEALLTKVGTSDPLSLVHLDASAGAPPD